MITHFECEMCKEQKPMSDCLLSTSALKTAFVHHSYISAVSKHICINCGTTIAKAIGNIGAPDYVGELTLLLDRTKRILEGKRVLDMDEVICRCEELIKREKEDVIK